MCKQLLMCICMLTILCSLNAVYTTFTVLYPDANLGGGLIFLRGDNCNLSWNKGILLNHSSIDTWKTSLLCPQNTVVSVKASLNDTRYMFGKNQIFKSTEVKNVTIYPSFQAAANKIVDSDNVTSSILGNSRKCSIYYPPSYFDNRLKKYELLIMHDGQNLFDPAKAAFGTAWLIQNTLNSLAAQGNIREIIVVGVWNSYDRNNQYTYSYDPSYKFGGKGDMYLDFIQKQLLPIMINDWFKGRVMVGSYSIGGSSLGGLISCYATYTRPTIFTKSICMSSSFWWNNQDFNNKILSTQQLYQNISVYLDSGDSGPNQDALNQTIRVTNHLIKIGYKNQHLFYYLDQGGQHSQAYWGRRFYVPLMHLFP